MRLEHWQQSLCAALAGSDHPDWPAEAMAVHRGNVRGARVSTLGNVFPILRRVVGDGCFDGLARRYAIEVPSRNPDLNRCGRRFPAWLRTSDAARATRTELAYVVDLARMEYQVNEAWYEAADLPLDARSLERAADDPARRRLRLPRSLRLLASRWPVDAIWTANRQRDGQAKAVAANSCRVVIWRVDAQVEVRAIDVSAWRALRAALRGCALEKLPDYGMTPELIGDFVQRGWVLGAGPV